MIVRKEIDLTQPLTPSQVEMLHNLESKPISPDEDPKNLCRKQRRTLQANRHAAAFPANAQTCKISW